MLVRTREFWTAEKTYELQIEYIGPRERLNASLLQGYCQDGSKLQRARRSRPTYP